MVCDSSQRRIGSKVLAAPPHAGSALILKTLIQFMQATTEQSLIVALRDTPSLEPS
jgi:hypothetical protein